MNDINILVQVRFRTEVLCTPSSTRPGFELMTSRLWQYISCHWDACSNYLAISDFKWKRQSRHQNPHSPNHDNRIQQTLALHVSFSLVQTYFIQERRVGHGLKWDNALMFPVIVTSRNVFPHQSSTVHLSLLVSFINTLQYGLSVVIHNSSSARLSLLQFDVFLFIVTLFNLLKAQLQDSFQLSHKMTYTCDPWPQL